MSDYYQTEGSCRRCLRSSPIPSLIGMIFVLLGGAAFGAGAIFANNTLKEMINYKDEMLFNYVTYGVIGAIVLFTVLAYLLCALSTGYNAKQCFDTPQKSICGRCCNMFLILCLIFGLFLWILIACLLTYPLISTALLAHKQISSNQAVPFDLNNVMAKNKPQAEGLQGVEPRENLINNLSEKVTNVLTTGNEIDLSYYGIPKKITASVFDKSKEKVVLCISAALVGVLLMIFGYLLIILCVAMNYARLYETRYYEADDCDEAIALRQ